jgi:predicted alpha/beta-hydrolase family hydrolase
MGARHDQVPQGAGQADLIERRSASMRRRFICATLWLCVAFTQAAAQPAPKVIDIPTRPGVTQRMLVLSPAEPKAAVVLLAGGHGGLQLQDDGSMKWGNGNFLVRSRQMFADRGLMVAVLDAPSDRQSPPFLQGLRQQPEHVADVKAVIAWLRSTAKVPVWLVGTSRGTQSAAYIATELAAPDGPDGIVLSSTILADNKSRAVPSMPLGKIRVPVLVVHHEQDECKLCAFADMHGLTSKLASTPKSQLLSFKGGQSQGDACEAFAYHGFNGIESEVVQQTVAWMLAK